MKYRVVFKDGAVCIPVSAFDACDDIVQIRFLMLLSYDRALCDADDTMLAEQLGCSLEELQNAVWVLREKGLLEPEKKLVPTADTKNMSGSDIAERIDGNKALKQLIEECELLCGKVFTATDLSKLVSLNSKLGFECDTIYLMFCYYMEKLDAVGRRISVSYLERSAYSLYNQDIRTTEQLQKYIKNIERQNSSKYKLARMFDMGDRPFTKKQKSFFEKWLNEWEMPFDLIECAYEISVNNTGKASIEYMSKILSDWHSSGVTTVEQAEKASENFKRSNSYVAKFKEKSNEADKNENASFNTEEFFEKALKRSCAWMKSMQNKGEGET